MDSNSADTDILRPLSATEFRDLLLLYKNNYLKTTFHYISLFTQNKWNEQLEAVDDSDSITKWRPFRKSFFTHRNGNPANGTYVSLHWDMMLSVQFYSLEPSLQELKECFLETNRIDWSSGPLITGVLNDNHDFVMEILNQVGAKISRARECYCLLLSPEAALKHPEPQLPEGYSFRQLLPEDAKLIHSLWPNKKEGSIEYIQGLTLLCKTTGIVRLTDDALVGWIFQNDFSGLGILQVCQEEQRKGFGKKLAIKISREVALEELIDISAFIVKENIKSEGLLKGIGFQYSTTNFWMQCKNLQTNDI